jgi:hypothetical protein
VSLSSNPPYVQPAIPRSSEPAASPATDGWPPSRWFETQSDTDSQNNPFDWQAPPAGFGLRDGYDWIDRVLVLYRRVWPSDFNPSEHNDSGWSALTNAYAIIDDLRRRHLLGLRQFRRWTKSVEALHPDAEISFLEEAREYLIRAIADMSSIDRRNAEPRLRADTREGSVFLDNTKHPVSAEAALFIQLLLEQKGEFISLAALAAAMTPILGARPLHIERQRDSLPAEILRDTIEVTPRGHRIRREYLG